MVDTWGSAGDDLCRQQFRQILKPQAGGFCLRVAELPWLDDLIGLSDAGADDADGVFKADMLNGSIQQRLDEL